MRTIIAVVDVRAQPRRGSGFGVGRLRVELAFFRFLTFFFRSLFRSLHLYNKFIQFLLDVRVLAPCRRRKSERERDDDGIEASVPRSATSSLTIALRFA